jgi:hypothetical protein
MVKVWVKPQSKFSKIFIVALSFSSISPPALCGCCVSLSFAIFIADGLAVFVAVVTANKMAEKEEKNAKKFFSYKTVLFL